MKKETTSSSEPKISVIMPVYNGEKFLTEAIKSILSQTYRNFEFLILDDGSTDRSNEICKKFEDKDHRIKILSRGNRGIVSSLNELADAARGKYLARMDADDFSLPERLEKQVEYLENNKNIGVVGGKVTYCDQKMRPIFTTRAPIEHTEIDENNLSGNCIVVHPSTVIRKDVFRKAGGYDERYSSAQDLDLWLKIAEFSEIYVADDLILKYRLLSTSDSGSKQKYQATQTENACKEAWTRRGLSERTILPLNWRPVKGRKSRKKFFLKWGWQAWSAGNQRTAQIYFFKALKLQPFSGEVWRAILFGVILSKK